MQIIHIITYTITISTDYQCKLILLLFISDVHDNCYVYDKDDNNNYAGMIIT